MKEEHKIPESVKKSITTRVGYVESENKKSCQTGADVAFNIAEEYYEPIINNLKRQLDFARNPSDQLKNDIKMLSAIFKRYSA